MEKDIKTILSECGFGFKKQLGQNFKIGRASCRERV